MSHSRKRRQSSKLKPQVLSEHNHTCWICCFDFAPILSVHHIVLISEGGDNDLDNLVILCPNCHAIVHKIIKVLRDHYDKNIDEMSSGAYSEYALWSAKEISAGRLTAMQDAQIWTLAHRGAGRKEEQE